MIGKKKKKDIDECLGQGGGNNCSANAICTNINSSFTCTCKDGFGGDGVVCSGNPFTYYFVALQYIIISFLNF